MHVSLYYPHLDLDQTMGIFELNLGRLEKIEDQRAAAGRKKLHILRGQLLEFATDHFRDSNDDQGRWNGRQIRNAFQIAAALAHLEADESGPDTQPQLRRSHFENVADAIQSYDKYRKKLLGKYDDEIAAERKERGDSDAQNARAPQPGIPPEPNPRLYGNSYGGPRNRPAPDYRNGGQGFAEPAPPRNLDPYRSDQMPPHSEAWETTQQGPGRGRGLDRLPELPNRRQPDAYNQSPAGWDPRDGQGAGDRYPAPGPEYDPRADAGLVPDRR